MYVKWRKLIGVSFASVCVSFLNACGGGGSDTQSGGGVTSDNFDFASMMVNYADNVIIPNYQKLSDAAADLSASDGALASYCANIGTENEAAEKALVLSEWKSLQSAIQTSELHILGPVLDNNGQLLNQINPLNSASLSTCGIDQSVVLASEDSTFSVASRTSNQRGSATLEYLLFNDDLSHSCPSQISETLGWNDRPELEKKQLRCEYAQRIADDLNNSASELLNIWAIPGGNYRGIFINPVNDSMSLSALSDAMFYLDVDVKDRKLGTPLGINNNACASTSCPDEVESPYSESSLVHIRTSLVSFENMLRGAEGAGFDDIIERAGVGALNTRMFNVIDDAIALIDTMNTSLGEQAAAITDTDQEAACANAFANPSVESEYPACRLYGYIKMLTDDLKVDFVAAVNVDLPDRAQSDND